MKEIICGLQINYTVAGTGNDVILLHGWGQNIEMMEPLAKFLQTKFRVWILDLPGGAGASDEPKDAWDIYDYSTMLSDFIYKHNITKPSLIGHSFGGRIAIVYASTHPDVEKVVLLDAAGVKPKRGFDYYAKVYSYKLGKSVLSLPGLNKLKSKHTAKAGSNDYQQASPIMKQILSKVVNQDLQHHMPNIQAPTLLIWGELDDATPVSDAKIMEQLIPNAGLIVLPNAGHYAYLECLDQVQRILESFFS